ncbi:DegT/DnrJ/EryC1/StrS family aminotransferase [Lutibacter holmesii]|uniref:DegT/DnrJ/EryC1/StrS family aminotransferase n=1 Tax=Lutibacter holmesii TaxID=1137985 RepID=A0ABW3WQP8_9FLAO
MKNKIWLSSPHMSGTEQNFIQEVFDTNWIAPVGDQLMNFETDLENFLGNQSHVLAVNSGTAAIHLALKLLGISKGDEVLCQSFTFCASANPILYEGAIPIFIDSEDLTWNLSPYLLEKAIKNRLKNGIKPKAIIAVDSYGMPFKVSAVRAIANKYEIPIIEDAAGALGSKVADIPCGTLAEFGVISFNGNKIITTSSGGALISTSKNMKAKALFFATQARDVASHYQHSEIGYNYRMSNVLAGIGRGQLTVIDERVQARRAIFEFYKKELQGCNELKFLEEPKGYYSNRWLSCIQTPSFEVREKIRIALDLEGIEARPLWKPLHLQPIFQDYLAFTNGVAEELFANGLCLPSGSNLTEFDLFRITNCIKKALKKEQL